jgi:HSP20 family protein
MSLTRWDPFSEMLTLRDAMDRLFEESFVLPRHARGSSNGANILYQLPVDVREVEDAYIVEAVVPGVAREAIEIEFQNGQLAISGELPMMENPGTYHLRERWAGKFYRSLRLPSQIDPNKIEASLEHGVLTLTLPKSEETKPRRIQVKNSQ